MTQYFGGFSDRDNVAKEFEAGTGDKYYANNPFIIAADFPTDGEIIFASYGGAAYEGDAWVIYQKDGKLYENHGSHCSCYGLEGQWDPEETSWEAIAMRNLQGYSQLADHEDDAANFLAGILKGKGFEPIMKGRYEQ